jgi:hypothetical protein
MFVTETTAVSRAITTKTQLEMMMRASERKSEEEKHPSLILLLKKLIYRSNRAMVLCGLLREGTNKRIFVDGPLAMVRWSFSPCLANIQFF